jgi:hypothetical protein
MMFRKWFLIFVFML